MNKLLEYNNDEGTNGLSPTTRKTLNEIEQGVINAPGKKELHIFVYYKYLWMEIKW